MMEVAIILTVLLSLMAAPVLGAEGDIKVDAEDADGDYDGDVVLYDASDNQVDTLDADDGVATFEAVQHGDYYVEATDSSGAAVQSETFTHEADETVVEYDIEDNSITVSENEDLTEPEAPSADNIVDNANDGDIKGFIPILFGAFIVLAVFGVVALAVVWVLNALRR